MAFYRAYNVDLIGKTLGFVSFEAANDADACSHVESFRKKDTWRTVDVWEGHRKLAYPV
jgi:hypothetical protein